jgi:hypothetical protein
MPCCPHYSLCGALLHHACTKYDVAPCSEGAATSGAERNHIDCCEALTRKTVTVVRYSSSRYAPHTHFLPENASSLPWQENRGETTATRNRIYQKPFIGKPEADSFGPYTFWSLTIGLIHATSLHRYDKAESVVRFPESFDTDSVTARKVRPERA